MGNRNTISSSRTGRQFSGKELDNWGKKHTPHSSSHFFAKEKEIEAFSISSSRRGGLLNLLTRKGNGSRGRGVHTLQSRVGEAPLEKVRGGLLLGDG